MTDKEAFKKILKLIVSGKISKELYNEYLGDTEIGFMSFEELETYFSEPQPTLSECIKEWEERGYSVNDYGREIIIESEKYDLDINICKANLIYEISNYYRDKPACVSPDLHHLLSKTLKALEVER